MRPAPYAVPSTPQIIHIHHNSPPPQLSSNHSGPYVRPNSVGSVHSYRPNTPLQGQLPLPRPGSGAGSGYFAPDASQSQVPAPVYRSGSSYGHSQGHHGRHQSQGGSYTGSLSRNPPSTSHSHSRSRSYSNSNPGQYYPPQTQENRGYYRPSSSTSFHSQHQNPNQPDRERERELDLDELDRERRARRESQRKIDRLEDYARYENQLQRGSGGDVQRSLSTH